MTHVGWATIGTGFAATRRAKAIVEDPRAQLVAVAGRDRDRTAKFCAELLSADAAEPNVSPHEIDLETGWRDLLARDDIDAIAVCTISRDHADRTRAILEAGKHAIVEYPLAFDPAEARALLDLARSRDLLLHVEHIELLGGLHRAARENIADIGAPYYARYVTLAPKRPAPQRWSYRAADFGFPFVGALSRVMRAIDLFGAVDRVSASVRYWPREGGDYYTSCLCRGELRFTSGAIVELVYSKGDRVWERQNQFEIFAEAGVLTLTTKSGQLVRGEETRKIAIGGRRGLFARDTQMATAAILDGAAMYVQPERSIYALAVADGLRRAAESGVEVAIEIAYEH
ncbi:MAG: Gfo/Idh/MocA family protein [Geitlerinemataceae cyanobacterium]